MIKKTFENRQMDINIDTIKFVIKINIYDDILNLFNHKDNRNLKNNLYTIDNTIKIKLIDGFKYTHITLYGLKSHNESKDIKRNEILTTLIKYIVKNVPLNKIFLKKLDLAIDYKVHPSSIFIYKTFTINKNKCIKLHELNDNKSYEDNSLYLHDFQYYKANLYKIKNEIFNLGIPLVDEIKIELVDKFELHYNDNYTGKSKERMLIKYIKDLYSKIGLEFIKYDNNNYYLYVPKDTFESNAYKSIKNNCNDKGFHFKPDTSKSHVIIYDKKNKLHDNENIELKNDLTRVEFVINFRDNVITNVNDITKVIYRELNKVFITDYIIEKTTFNSFIKEYNENNLFDDNIRDTVIDNVLELLKEFI